jgi:PDZ domain-containing secreted protein
MKDEMKSAAKRAGTTDYELLDRKDRQAAYELAQESAISDALSLSTREVEVEVDADTSKLEKKMLTVEDELVSVFGNLEGLTFDKVVN